LPSFVTLVADNQSASVRELVKDGVVRCLGCSGNVSVEEYGRALESVTADQLAQMSRRGMKLVDGLGCMRVADCLFEKMVELNG
jgi:spore coat polysaccharide biosynthesis predicted glycosyltransferase SpsG